jgi:hypothetical protein
MSGSDCLLCWFKQAHLRKSPYIIQAVRRMMLLAAYQNKAWTAKCQSKSYSVAYYCIFYCTSLVTEPINTLYCGTPLTVYNITATCFGPSQPITSSIIYKTQCYVSKCNYALINIKYCCKICRYNS